MAAETNEFASEFFQEIIAASDANGVFAEDVFFEKFCDHLVAAGEILCADRAAYRGSPRAGIRVDGYGGDPDEHEAGTLSLIVCDFHQDPVTGRLTGREMDAIFHRAEKFLKQSLNANWRNALEETSAAFGLADLISQRWGGIGKVRLFLISNRELSNRVDRRESEKFDGRVIAYSVWDIRRLQQFVTAGLSREHIEVDLEREFGMGLPILSAQQSKADYESYLAVVPGAMLASIYDRWGTRLLEQNVRVFLQARGNVNKGIKNTLENDPAMFFAYNNGITATAERITTKISEGRVLLCRIKNFQIVNGGQTTASIHAAYRNKADLSRIFVPMKLSVVLAEQADKVVPKISEYANSQNRVNAADFFSNHPFHVRVEEFSRRMYAPSPDGTFRQSKWFYERARGQYADARALLTPTERKKFSLENPRHQLISKTDLAKFLNVWRGRPHQVSLGAQKNFALFAKEVGQAWKKDPDQFNEEWYREAVAKAIVFRACEKIVSAQSWYQGGYRANIVAYSIAKMACDVAKLKQAVNFQLIWKKQAICSEAEKTLSMIAEKVHDVLISPPAGISNVTEWAKKQGCWDRVQATKIKLRKAFLDQLISLEEEKESARKAKLDQKELNGIQAQIAAVSAGPDFWAGALAWGRERGLLTPKETGVISAAAQPSRKTPLSEAQAVVAISAFYKLKEAGFDKELSANS